MRQILRFGSVVILTAVFIYPMPERLVYAQQLQSTPLLLPADIQAAAAPKVFQGVQSGPSGAVHYSDEVLAFPVKPNPNNSDLLVTWQKSHRFFVVPIDIGIAPAEGLIPERVDLSVAFAGLGQMDRQPLVIDAFPKTGFEPSGLTGKAEVKLGADLKFSDVAPVSANGGANASLSYTYTPAYANVVSGYGSATAFWQFIRTQDKYPIGEIPTKLIIAVPKSRGTQALAATIDVRVEYPGGWFQQKGLSVASFHTRVELPNDK
jgi:hypothetical protein